MTQAEREASTQRHQRIYKATHTASSLDKIPDVAHFAILVEESMRYDDGYGENGHTSYSTHNYLSYVFFDTEEALDAWIVENHLKKKFKVINVKAVEFELKTTIRLRSE